MGAQLHYLILDYLKDLEGSIIEIGGNRGESSTDFYAGLTYGLDKFKFYTIDIDQNVSFRSQQLAQKIPRMAAYAMSGEKFLTDVFPKFNEKVCYAYLDNFDWNAHENEPEDTWPEWVNEFIKQYGQHGLSLTQKNSAEAHLEQTKLIEKYAASKCIIQLDDTFGDHTHIEGKGMLAVPYLVKNGWNTVLFEHGTVLMANY
jgi:hypothetical protein